MNLVSLGYVFETQISPKTWMIIENGLLSEIFETKYSGTTRCSVSYVADQIS